MPFNFLDYGPTTIRLFVENDGLKTEFLKESSHRLSSSLVMAVNHKYSI